MRQGAGRGSGLIAWMAVWVANVVLAIVSVRLLRAGHIAPGLRPLVALMPAYPLPFGLALFVVLLRRMDEFRRQLTIGAFALSSALTGIVVYGWSLLRWTGAGDIPTVWVFPAELLLWGAFMLIARLRFP